MAEIDAFHHAEAEATSPIEYLNDEYFWNYCIILPLISVFGIVSNILNLCVLSKNQFQRVMFSYMKVLSMSDIAYLVYTIQACIFTDLGYFLTDGGKQSTNYVIEIYVWIMITPFWNAFASLSDFIVVCMTLARFKIIKNADKITLKEFKRMNKNHNVSIIALVCALFSLLVHFPYFFQYQIVSCEEAGLNVTGNHTGDCWAHTNTGKIRSL